MVRRRGPQTCRHVEKWPGARQYGSHDRPRRQLHLV